MQNLSSRQILSIVTNLLTILLVSKILSLLVWWYLPCDGVELNAKESYQAKYQRVDFKNMLVKAELEPFSSKYSSRTSLVSINSLVLKGLYGNKSGGFAILAKKASPAKTTIVEVAEVYEGYKLKEINLNEVIFIKNSKEYILKLENSKINNAREVGSSPYEISEASVRRSDIRNYSKNPSKIWKDISISPLRKSGKVVGFRVKRIKAGSKMAQLGLKKGDLIIRANNVKLTSSNDAIKLYKNINKLDTISLIVLRNNQEKEIIYDIY